MLDERAGRHESENHRQSCIGCRVPARHGVADERAEQRRSATQSGWPSRCRPFLRWRRASEPGRLRRGRGTPQGCLGRARFRRCARTHMTPQRPSGNGVPTKSVMPIRPSEKPGSRQEDAHPSAPAMPHPAAPPFVGIVRRSRARPSEAGRAARGQHREHCHQQVVESWQEERDDPPWRNSGVLSPPHAHRHTNPDEWQREDQEGEPKPW